MYSFSLATCLYLSLIASVRETKKVLCYRPFPRSTLVRWNNSSRARLGGHFHTFAVFLSTLTATRRHCLLECGKSLLATSIFCKLLICDERNHESAQILLQTPWHLMIAQINLFSLWGDSFTDAGYILAK